jgi:hypothetical protein
MAFTETGSEKIKREAYYKANKERGIRAEKKKEYEVFGTTEQNIPAVDTMGGVTGMKKGGKVMKAKRYDEGGDIQTETKQGQNEAIKDDTRARAMAALASGNMDQEVPKPKPRMKTRSKSNAMTNAMSRMNAMGDTYKAGGKVAQLNKANGIAQRGKTRGKMC